MAPPAVLVRSAHSDDHDDIRDLLVDAFGDEGAHLGSLVARLRRHPCGRDGMEFVAESRGAVVGHTMVTRSRLDCLPATIEVGVLSPLAVASGHQRQGIGSQLVQVARATAEDVGLPLVFVEGDPAVYSRMGAQPALPLGFRKPSLRIPDAAFQCWPLAGDEPWMRGTLVYAEPFWEFDAVGLRRPAFLEWLTGEIAAGRAR